MTVKTILVFATILHMSISCKAQSKTALVSLNHSTLYQWDFEDSDALHNLGIEDESSLKNGISIVADPLDVANKVLKTVLRQGKDRTEVSLYTSDLKNIIYCYANASNGYNEIQNTFIDNNSLGNELWMSIKILKPQEQNTNGIKPCLLQFGPVSNATFQPQSSSSGFCQLRIRNGTAIDEDQWNWRVFGTGTYTPTTLNTDTNFVRPSYNKWEKFVIHCKYSTATDGLIEVWKDGIKYISLAGANATAFNRFRIKWGIYLGVGNHAGQELRCYFDDVKIGGSNSSFEQISQ